MTQTMYMISVIGGIIVLVASHAYAQEIEGESDAQLQDGNTKYTDNDFSQYSLDKRPFGSGSVLFGKRMFKFGKRGDISADEIEDYLYRYGNELEKRKILLGRRGRQFLFGKRSSDMEDEEKRMFKFGKRDPVMEDEEEKRMFKFGKRDPTMEEEEKRMFKFGKRDPTIEDAEKRMFKFGKRDSQMEDAGKRMFKFGKRAFGKSILFGR